MPKRLHEKLIAEIQEVTLDVYTIIIYSGDSHLLILRTGPRGGIFWERHYAAIGSGALIANTVLCQTPHDSNMSLLSCLVRIVTAKALAERDPYVGRNTSLGVILGDGSRYDISNDVWEYLMQRITTPAIAHAYEDGADIALLGRRLQEGETGQARYTSGVHTRF
jgi:20S proteasome alpha/beta subunit